MHDHINDATEVHPLHMRVVYLHYLEFTTTHYIASEYSFKHRHVWMLLPLHDNAMTSSGTPRPPLISAHWCEAQNMRLVLIKTLCAA